MKPFFLRILKWMFYLAFLGAFVGCLVFWAGVRHFSKDLPSIDELENYYPPVVTRVFSSEGLLIRELLRERRVFAAYEAIPPMMVQALISAEDKYFWQHRGVNFLALARSMLFNVQAAIQGGRMLGASTITQQVARNFVLSSERTIERKIKEMILATRIEKALTKERIIELYLSEIDLGQSRYGVIEAARHYFSKSLNELNLSEIAYLAGVPKNPYGYHPVRNNAKAKERRDYVLRRLWEDQVITDQEYHETVASPLVAKIEPSSLTRVQEASYFATEVTKELEENYGRDLVRESGMVIRTTLDLNIQEIAVNAVREGLLAYDKRYGWRGPVKNIPIGQTEEEQAEGIAQFNKLVVRGQLPEWKLAWVQSFSGSSSAKLLLKNGETATLYLKDMAWARKALSRYRRGPRLRSPQNILSRGDVIFVQEKNGRYQLEQLPEVEGAMVVMDSSTGRVRALVGGFSFEKNQYNRATQAERQPGSAFKPFIYLAGFDHGLTPDSLVHDGEMVFYHQGERWAPKNNSGRFYGNVTLANALVYSHNLSTVRLAEAVGMHKIAAYAKEFGVYPNMSFYLPNALGAHETTLLRLTTGYAMLANGGKKIHPTLIDIIEDRYGESLYLHEDRRCPLCDQLVWSNQLRSPSLQKNERYIANPITTYQVTELLRQAVQSGTARSMSSELKPYVAGKTGTTNDSKDAWFLSFTQGLVVGVWVGFDTPRSLGPREGGGRAAIPIANHFYKAYFKEYPAEPFIPPEPVDLVGVDASTQEFFLLDRAEGDILQAYIPYGLSPIDPLSLYEQPTRESWGAQRSGSVSESPSTTKSAVKPSNSQSRPPTTSSSSASQRPPSSLDGFIQGVQEGQELNDFIGSLN